MVTEQDGAVEEFDAILQEEQPKKRRRRERDPMAPKPGRKPGSTALHKILSPAHLEEVHEQLTWDKLESVQAYIAQMGYVDKEGKPLISINQLKYYRGRFIKPEERMGYGRLCQLLRKYRVRLPPIAALETALSIQFQRLGQGLKEEEEHKTTIPQVGQDLDLLDRMIGRLYKMKQEAGLIPQALPPIQRHQVQADVQAQTQATVESTVRHRVAPEDAKEIIKLLKKNLKAQALKAKDEKHD